jgi:hypothetical protein
MLGAPFMTLMPEMWDYEARIRDMDKAGVDLAVVSLTCPNAYFGDVSVSTKAATMVNDDMAEQQRARPDRIAWFASLPWQYADAAPLCGRRSMTAHYQYSYTRPPPWARRKCTWTNTAWYRRSVSCLTRRWQSYE